MAVQLALDSQWTTNRRRPVPPRPVDAPGSEEARCAECRAKEARYGFRSDPSGAGDPPFSRPSTLCFECFRAEIARRRGASSVPPPRPPRPVHTSPGDTELARTLESLSLRRRRAQLAARSALGLR
jgi:hypothetical protein